MLCTRLILEYPYVMHDLSLHIFVQVTCMLSHPVPATCTKLQARNILLAHPLIK